MSSKNSQLIVLLAGGEWRGEIWCPVDGAGCARGYREGRMEWFQGGEKKTTG